ncbi:MAG: hypothetical protein WAU77_07700 [Solirubrobacteraceae bacterium]
MSIPIATTCDRPASSGLLLDAALSLAQTQLVGQLADETSVDGRTMGTLGFSGALFAADLAARSVLGAFWWMPLIILSLAALCCLGPTLGLGVDFGRGTDLGPIADVFYRLYRAGSPPTTNEQLLSDLGRAISNNARRLQAKERALQVAVVILVMGLPASIAFMGLS